MDCNKEEASRAKTLAENLMRNGDFFRAQKLVMKAQRLFSGLESLPQMLAVCDVHCSAENKINGLENWYGILQVKHFSDDATIKKQYKKLALLLHPDKNQFAGGEAAFKLIGEANRLLADKEKRTQYDIKHRIYSRVANRQFNANSSLQCAAANNASESTVNNATFWTCCEHCGYRYKYLRKDVNKDVYCTSCQRSFMVYDTGFNGVAPKSSTGKKKVQNQGPCNTPVNKNLESTCAQPGSVAAELDKKETSEEKADKNFGGGENEYTDVRKPKIKEGLMKAELPEADGLKPQPEVTEPEKGASKSVPDESFSTCDQAPSLSKDKKRRRKIVEEPTESMHVELSDVFEDKAYSEDNNRRTSPRKSQQVSCAKKGSSDDAISPPTKKSRSGVGSKSERTRKKQNIGVGPSKRLNCDGSSTPSCVYNGKAKKNVDSGSATARGEGMCIAGKINNNQKPSDKPITQDSPDPDFNNFEPTTSSFAVNQVWSLYDPTDGMPRFYALIEKVIDSEFKLWIKWLDPFQDNKDNSIPIACGIFQDGELQEVDDHLIFSCQMLHRPRDNNIVIYPGTGEVWAVFRGWDISCSASLEKHKQTYEYDYVEVLSDFKDVDGLEVAYLVKVEGFVSLFCRDAKYGVLQLQIPPNEMLRFSHKVPSFKMTGREREGVPPGCFELDTAALPNDMFEVANCKADVGLNGERPNGKTGGPIPEVSKVEAQANTTLESRLSPKKRQKIHDNHSSFSKASERTCSNHEMKPVKKSRKSVKAGNDLKLKLRKSPGLLSETNIQASSRSGQEKSEKKTAKDGESLDLETHGPSSYTTGQENNFNFENQRSSDKFQIDQVWAIYSNDKGMPRKYAQIKRIDTSPEFKLHVAPLVLYRPPNLMTHPVCCGCFKLKTGKADVLVPRSFSHQVKAVKTNINRYEVYPGKNEIWALYKNWNTTDCAETEELEIVEVVKTNEKSIQVMLLTANVFSKLLYGRSQELKTDFVDIPRAEVSRFSHQIPAFKHERRATRFGDSECWELDPKAVVDLNSKKP